MADDFDIDDLIPGGIPADLKGELKQYLEKDSLLVKQAEYLKARGWTVAIHGPFGPDYMKDPETGQSYQTCYATNLQAYRDGLVDDVLPGMKSMIAPIPCQMQSVPCQNWAWPTKDPKDISLCPDHGGPVHKTPKLSTAGIQKKAPVKPKKVMAAKPHPAAEKQFQPTTPVPGKTAEQVGAQKRAELMTLKITGLDDYTDAELAWAQLNCTVGDAMGGEASEVLNFMTPGSAFVNIAGTMVPFTTAVKKPTPKASAAPAPEPAQLHSDPNALANNWDEWE